MKLLDILARELEEWPDDMGCIAQDNDGVINSFRGWPAWVDGPGMWRYNGNFNSFKGITSSQLADDHATAIITREQWEEARRGLSGSVKDAVSELKEYEKASWRGPQDGLPPVGTVCEHFATNTWEKCEIKAYVMTHGANCAVVQLDNCWNCCDDADRFRPLKSDRDRWIEQAEEAMLNTTMGSDFAAIWDAGLGKLKEEE